MVRKNFVLPYLPQKWYGNCRACRTSGAPPMAPLPDCCTSTNQGRRCCGLVENM